MTAEQDPHALTNASEAATAPKATPIGPSGLAFKPLAASKRGANTLSMLHAARSALRQAGVGVMIRDALRDRVLAAESYDSAIAIMEEYVEFYR